MDSGNPQGGRSSSSQVIIANNQSPVQSLVHQSSKHSVPRSSLKSYGSGEQGGQIVVNSMVNIDGQKIEYNSENSGSKKTSRGSSRIQILELDPFNLENEHIYEQMVGHYIWFGLLLVIAHFAGWAYIWFWTLPLYCFSSYSVLQITRLVHALSPRSLVPMYLSFFPYIVFQFLSREAHSVFSILWYISVMALTLQLGSDQLRSHIVFSVLTFVALYGISTSIMSVYFVSNNENTFSLATNITQGDYNSPAVNGTCSAPNFMYSAGNCYNTNVLTIKSAEEITFACSIALIGISVSMLQRFIQEYAYSLLDRMNHVNNLTKINTELKNQLKAMKNEIDLDLDSPITKVIKVIRGIQQSGDLDAETMENFDHVVDILSSNQLFMPNLNAKDGMDSDVNKWLNAMVTNQSAPVKPFALSHNSSLSDPIEQSVDIIAREVQANDSVIRDILKTTESWDFNVFDLREATKGRPLYYLVMHLFEKYKFYDAYQIDYNTVKNFVEKIESGYKSNPYHNSTHASDVTHAVHYFISVLGLNELVTLDECFSGIVASMIHDFEHPGQTNAFLINTSDNMAIRYNDTSVLEFFHSARAFEIMLNDPSYNILGRLPREKFKQLRTCITTMVLATDMSSHFEYISKFKNKTSGAGLDFTDQKDRQLIMDIAIKCGDISNAGKKLDLCKKWAELIMEEFWAQGDEEKKRNIPVSMFMDRNNSAVHKCQMGFIDYIVSPLYEVWDTYMNEDDIFPAIKNMAKNREYWKKIQEQENSVAVAINK